MASKRPGPSESSAPKSRARRTAVESKPPARTKKPMGRPTDYTPELADRICAQLACGLSLRSVCKSDDMPSAVSVFAWLRKYPEFLKQYGAAKAEAADAMVDEMIDIADDGTNDWMEMHDKDGECVGYKLNGEHVQRSRLRIDTRKWIAERMKPKLYGSKVDLNHGIEEGNPLATLMQQLAGKTLKPVPENE